MQVYDTPWLLKWQHTVINPSLSLQWEKPDIIVHSWLIMSFLSLYINSCHARWNAVSLCYFLWNIKITHLWIICNLAALNYSIYYNYYSFYNISVMLSLQQICNHIMPSLMQKKFKKIMGYNVFAFDILTSSFSFRRHTQWTHWLSDLCTLHKTCKLLAVINSLSL